MILQIDLTWPVSLPLPFLEFSGSPENATLVSPPESSAILRRSRFTKSYSTIAVAWTFTEDQFQTFEDFFLNDLGNGVAQFKIELRFPTNSVLAKWSVRLKEGYQSNFVEGIWKVQASLFLVNPVNF